jgi:hypothetical protein
MTDDLREFATSLRATRKISRTAFKTVAWAERLRAELDNLLLKDFPDSYARKIYFPSETATAARVPEATTESVAESNPELSTAEASDAETATPPIPNRN